MVFIGVTEFSSLTVPPVKPIKMISVIAIGVFQQIGVQLRVQENPQMH
jgi:hypothetical protein